MIDEEATLTLAPDLQSQPFFEGAIGSRSQTERATQLLRADIVDGALVPGLKLKLEMLRDRYDIGAAPLREALSRLAADRLVVAQHNRGYIVAPLRQEDLEDLQRTRLAVELPALLESMQRGGEAWESAVITAHYRLSRCLSPLETRDTTALAAWEERHDQFHTALLSACSSGWLLHFQQQIGDQLRRYHRILGALSPGCADGGARAPLPATIALHHHTQLMEAALERDATRATALMAEHAESTIQVLQGGGDTTGTSA